MTLYTKKKGEYIPLTKENIRALRRVDKVVGLQKASWELATTTMALATWLKRIENQANTLRTPADIVVTRVPNQERMKSLSMKVMDQVRELRKL